MCTLRPIPSLVYWEANITSSFQALSIGKRQSTEHEVNREQRCLVGLQNFPATGAPSNNRVADFFRAQRFEMQQKDLSFISLSDPLAPSLVEDRRKNHKPLSMLEHPRFSLDWFFHSFSFPLPVEDFVEPLPAEAMVSASMMMLAEQRDDQVDWRHLSEIFETISGRTPSKWIEHHENQVKERLDCYACHLGQDAPSHKQSTIRTSKSLDDIDRNGDENGGLTQRSQNAGRMTSRSRMSCRTHYSAAASAGSGQKMALWAAVDVACDDSSSLDTHATQDLVALHGSLSCKDESEEVLNGHSATEKFLNFFTSNKDATLSSSSQVRQRALLGLYVVNGSTRTNALTEQGRALEISGGANTQFFTSQPVAFPGPSDLLDQIQLSIQETTTMVYIYYCHHFHLVRSCNHWLPHANKLLC